MQNAKLRETVNKLETKVESISNDLGMFYIKNFQERSINNFYNIFSRSYVPKKCTSVEFCLHKSHS